MSAAVAQRNSPRMPRPTSRTRSPMDKKRSIVKVEADNKDLPLQDRSKTEPSSAPKEPTTSQKDTKPQIQPPPQPVALPASSLSSSTTTKQTAPATVAAAGRDSKPGAIDAGTSQPLAPPPRPSQQNQQQNQQGNPSEGPDYFSSTHGTQYSLEPNLFEQSFGNTSSAETPGKLPPVASLASPAPLTGNGSISGFGWAGSLRSGPLSPAMLSGPAPAGDYFESIRGTFPTPNESSLRTGLTPGGGGSMFPAPSPNTQNFLGNLVSGGTTPSTLEFQRAAVNAAAASKTNPQPNNEPSNASTQAATTRPAPAATTASMDQAATAPAPNQNTFGQHDNDAANGLFLLAQAGNESQSTNQFTVANPPTQDAGKRGSVATSNGHPARSNTNMTASSTTEGNADGSDDNSKPSTRKSKRSTAGKGGSSKKKTDETPAKQPASKKAKANSGSAHDISMDMDDDDSDDADLKQEINENGKKMTDEEKRKNFLERNRVAALKCRQRKKQWLQNLQQKVEIFSSENDALNAQVSQLREEILNLKTILIAHKDCPITQQQQHVESYMQSAEFNNHSNPYSMGMQQGQQVMAGPRRYS